MDIRSRRAVAGAAVLFAALGTLPSCSEPSRPVYEVGAVQGYLIEAGRGVALRVAARALEGPSQGRQVATAMADSTGWYHLELPTGLYRIEPDPEVSGGYDSNDSDDWQDTIVITPHVHRLDLRRGRALIEVALPPDLDGERMDVELRGHTSMSLTEEVTSGRVAFDARLLGPARYLVRLSLWPSGQRIVLPAGTEPGAGDSLTVGVAELTRLSADLTAACASLSGSVTGSWQQAGAYPPWVDAVGENRRQVSRVGCEEDGAFTLHLLAPEPVRLRVRIDDVERWIGGDSFETAQVFELVPGDHLTSVSIVESGIEVVLEGPGDLLYHEAHITARSDAGAEYTRWAYNTSGSIPVCNLPPGRYYLRVDGRCNDQTWAPCWYPGVENLEDATPIDLAEGELRTVVLPLVEGGSISGDLLTAAGERPSPTTCMLFLSEEEALCQNGIRVEQGRFRFPGLPDGSYYLAVRLSYSERWWYPGTRSFAEASPLAITGRQPITGLVWRLPATGQEARP